MVSSKEKCLRDIRNPATVAAERHLPHVLRFKKHGKTHQYTSTDPFESPSLIKSRE